MSAEKCGETFSFEIHQRVPEFRERQTTPRSQALLQKIQQKEPGWDDWTIPGEIWFKAYKLGLLDEE